MDLCAGQVGASSSSNEKQALRQKAEPLTAGKAPGPGRGRSRPRLVGSQVPVNQASGKSGHMTRRALAGHSRMDRTLAEQGCEVSRFPRKPPGESWSSRECGPVSPSSALVDQLDQPLH